MYVYRVGWRVAALVARVLRNYGRRRRRELLASAEIGHAALLRRPPLRPDAVGFEHLFT